MKQLRGAHAAVGIAALFFVDVDLYVGLGTSHCVLQELLLSLWRGYLVTLCYSSTATAGGTMLC
jgi:hypothetical protein